MENLSGIVSLINALGSIALPVVIVWVVVVLRKHPNSVVSLDVPGIGKGTVSIEDAAWMIQDRLGEISEKELSAIRKFNNEQRSAEDPLDKALTPELLLALKNHGLIKTDADAAEPGKLRLALWGYRLLKDVMKVGCVHKPWEWVCPDEKKKLEGAEK